MSFFGKIGFMLFSFGFILIACYVLSWTIGAMTVEIYDYVKILTVNCYVYNSWSSQTKCVENDQLYDGYDLYLSYIVTTGNCANNVHMQKWVHCARVISTLDEYINKTSTCWQRGGCGETSLTPLQQIYTSASFNWMWQSGITLFGIALLFGISNYFVNKRHQSYQPHKEEDDEINDSEMLKV